MNVYRMTQGSTTQVLERTLPYREEIPVQPHREPSWGPGHPVGRDGAPSTPQHVSEERERLIHDRLSSFVEQGRELKIRSLFQEMERANLLPETRESIARWRVEFSHFSSQQKEERALALGAFVFRILCPALLREESMEIKALLVRWEARCQELMQGMISRTISVQTFLENCEQWLQEETMFRARCEREEVVQEAVVLAEQRIEERMNTALSLIRDRLRALQTDRRVVLCHLEEELRNVRQSLTRVQGLIFTRAQEALRVGEKSRKLHEEIQAVMHDLRALCGEV